MRAFKLESQQSGDVELCIRLNDASLLCGYYYFGLDGTCVSNLVKHSSREPFSTLSRHLVLRRVTSQSRRQPVNIVITKAWGASHVLWYLILHLSLLDSAIRSIMNVSIYLTGVPVPSPPDRTLCIRDGTHKDSTISCHHVTSRRIWTGLSKLGILIMIHMRFSYVQMPSRFEENVVERREKVMRSIRR